MAIPILRPPGRGRLAGGALEPDPASDSELKAMLEEALRAFGGRVAEHGKESGGAAERRTRALLLPDGRPAEPAAAALAEALDAPALARRVLEMPGKIRARKALAARARARLADAERRLRLLEAEIAAAVAAEAAAGGRAKYPNAEARAAELELRKARDPRWRAAEAEARRAREEWEAASFDLEMLMDEFRALRAAADLVAAALRGG